MCTSQNVPEKTEGCREEKKRLREGWKDGEVIGEEKGKEQRAGERGQKFVQGSLEISDCVHGCGDRS